MSHISNFDFHLDFVFCNLNDLVWLLDSKKANCFTLFVSNLNFSQHTITHRSKDPDCVAALHQIIIAFADEIMANSVEQEIIKDHEWINRNTAILQHEDRNKHPIVEKVLRHRSIYKWFVFLNTEGWMGK